ncbi:Phospholipase B-like protein [Aduncisulcus paluster]|uniref:Phospholipase B-like n=1 Tax=Aduncisulcus paluster TaxID=2918883 RepID=A0ABQ5L0P9_9EUKA|nr:Phospholipase B-like protein [Aduncisulcus paluster]
MDFILKIGFIVFILLSISLASADSISVGALYDSDTSTYSVVSKTECDLNPRKCVATGTFDDSLMSTGWNTAITTTKGLFGDSQQGYALGLIEAYAWPERIGQHSRHTKSAMLTYFCPIPDLTEYPDEILDFAHGMIDYIEYKISLEPYDEYWSTVSAFYNYMKGLQYGLDLYASNEEDKLSFDDVFMLNMVPDLCDLFPALLRDPDFDWHDLTYNEVKYMKDVNGHCSAYLVANDDWSDIFFSHNTWIVYNFATRVLRDSAMSLANAYSHVKYSSYPGCFASTDDFYVDLASKMMIFETTFNTFDLDAYDNLTTQSLPFSLRIMSTIALSDNGQTFIQQFSKENSGTYNSGFSVLDAKKITPGTVPTAAYTFTQIEQTPYQVEGRDYTTTFTNQGYFYSVNIPTMDDVYTQLGYDYEAQLYGDDWVYDECPRAHIFKRDLPNVNVLDDAKHVTRYNDYLNDEFSEGDPANAIASREDLRDADAGQMPMGAIDGKITSLQMINESTDHMVAISGPTYDQQPVFCWSTYPGEILVDHSNQSDCYQFDWIDF